MNKLSIRWRLTLWYGLALVVALTGFCLLILVIARHHALANVDTSLEEELTERVLEIQLARSFPELDSQLRTRFFQHDVYEFRVIDDTGKVVFSSVSLMEHAGALPGVKSLSDASPNFATISIGENGDYRMASAAAKSHLGNFIVQTMVSMKPFYSESHALQSIMLILLPLAVAVASVAGYGMAGRVLTPVQQIINAADAITIDRLDRRIEIVNPNDEIGRVATTLNSLIARLENAVTEIQRFTADASHELRTPLAALRAEAESALNAPRSPVEYQQSLRVILDEATRLGRLTDQLLHLSRLDAGTVGIVPEAVRIDALLLDVVEQLRPLAATHNVPIRVGQIQPCEIQGDDIRLSQSFFNILENALKYTPAPGRVEVRCRLSGHSVLIEIEDTGVGISAEALPHVFDRFYRGDPSRDCAVGGTGLGLAIARAAVLVHQGTIEIRSQPAVGSIVLIQFPNARLVADHCG